MIRTAVILYNVPCKAVLLLHVPCRAVVLLSNKVRLFSLHASTSSETPLSKVGSMVTFTLVNQAVATQGVAITEDRLNELKKIPPVSFTLPIDETVGSTFITLVGKPSTRKPRQGVYIFTHKRTGQRYVGSSDNLARRYNDYKVNTQNDSGLLIPLIREEGLDAFNLDIFVIPSHLKGNYPNRFLEQYHILTGDFKLNTKRIVTFNVNRTPNQDDPVYIYDKDKKILYYQAGSRRDVTRETSIHRTSINRYLNEDQLFLNTFVLTNQYIDDAEKSKLTPEAFNTLLDVKRTESSRASRNNAPVAVRLLAVSTGAKPIDFESKNAAVRYLIKKDYPAERHRLNEHLDNNEVYMNHYCTTIKPALAFKKSKS